VKKNSKSLTNSDPYGVSSHLGQECNSNHPYPDKRTDGSWQTSPPGAAIGNGFRKRLTEHLEEVTVFSLFEPAAKWPPIRRQSGWR
jgi:hypothetical protein